MGKRFVFCDASPVKGEMTFVEWVGNDLVRRKSASREGQAIWEFRPITITCVTSDTVSLRKYYVTITPCNFLGGNNYSNTHTDDTVVTFCPFLARQLLEVSFRFC